MSIKPVGKPVDKPAVKPAGKPASAARAGPPRVAGELTGAGRRRRSRLAAVSAFIAQRIMVTSAPVLRQEKLLNPLSANIVEVTRGPGPVVLAMPHVGTEVPAEIAARLNEEGRTLRDADWRVDRLYAGLLPGATIVRAVFHRYVIDANRDPSGSSLYPGQNTTGLVPHTNFDGEAIWISPPDAEETERRRATYHAAYHAALAAELARVKSLHGVVILYDCHSIRSHIPHLFDGALPDLNIGTNNGSTCDASVEAAVASLARRSGYSTVVNGRFKGGWTTRHYGRAADGMHAIQMELAQSLYLASEAPPFDYDAARADRLRGTLGEMLNALAALAPMLAEKAQA